jgi:hypothetical protein
MGPLLYLYSANLFAAPGLMTLAWGVSVLMLIGVCQDGRHSEPDHTSG